jgi:hypothetical protein
VGLVGKVDMLTATVKEEGGNLISERRGVGNDEFFGSSEW